MKLLFTMILNLVLCCSAGAKKSNIIDNFNEAKRIATKIQKEYPYTLYCGCKIQGKSVDLRSCGYKVRKDAKRAARLEWEHVVPAEAFGQSFSEWREGSPQCVKRGKRFKGRKCAQKNLEFSRMEGDLYNLWPEIGELNGLRSNYSMAQLTGSEINFGGCQVKLQDRKFEPPDAAKGIVARTYMYMNERYPNRGIISEKNEKLFAAWDKQFPVTPWECKRSKLIASEQGNENNVLEARCGASKRVMASEKTKD